MKSHFISLQYTYTVYDMCSLTYFHIPFHRKVYSAATSQTLFMLLNDQWIALLKITFSLTLSLYTVQTNNKDV